MKIISVNYQKRWGSSGTCYSQKIKIDNDLAQKYNNYLDIQKAKTESNFKKTHTYSEYDLKIKNLDFLRKGVNYTNLIHLGVFLELINVLNKDIKEENKIDFKRILWRNTLIEVDTTKFYVIYFQKNGETVVCKDVEYLTKKSAIKRLEDFRGQLGKDYKVWLEVKYL
jgi:hypothetical protein